MRDFLFDWHETLGAEHEALNALCMEDVCWVAAELDYVLVGGNVRLCHGLFTRTHVLSSLKLISLHLQLREGLLASLAIVRLIVHQVLNAANHD